MKYFLLEVVMISCFASFESLPRSNSKDATGTEHSSFVSLVKIHPRFHNTIQVLCSGVLISGKHVLTFAKCYPKAPLEDMMIYGGASDLTKCKAFEIKTWQNYSDWLSNKNNEVAPQIFDVAIITLSRSAEFADGMRPAILSFRTNKEAEGLKAKFFGWEGPRTLESSTLKLKYNNKLEILDDSTCQKLYARSRFHLKYANILCSSPALPLDSFDEGAPLFFENEMLLAVSWKTTYSKMGDNVNFHLNINFYSDFIKSVTA
ncbi:hypothetical protein QAD02_019143 [Eretmocerus hayati]|uniref:Uncharacterized protein n=1 Tax=Eretmocerus hayati TaxID=131215 RepID=A0ACC2PKL2_9HYME|nr:hypothetical protein QAD02_019143 [Eretmocerus hayati]